MSKYGQAVGIWELRVDEAKLDLKPKKGDNRRLLKIMTECKKRKDESFMVEEIGNFVKTLIERDYPPYDDKEQEELDMYIEFNIMELVKELLITFRWTTREDYDKEMDNLAGSKKKEKN